MTAAMPEQHTHYLNNICSSQNHLRNGLAGEDARPAANVRIERSRKKTGIPERKSLVGFGTEVERIDVLQVLNADVRFKKAIEQHETISARFPQASDDIPRFTY